MQMQCRRVPWMIWLVWKLFKSYAVALVGHCHCFASHKKWWIELYLKCWNEHSFKVWLYLILFFFFDAECFSDHICSVIIWGLIWCMSADLRFCLCTQVAKSLRHTHHNTAQIDSLSAGCQIKAKGQQGHLKIN